MMQKELYERADLRLTAFESNDVIATSDVISKNRENGLKIIRNENASII